MYNANAQKITWFKICKLFNHWTRSVSCSSTFCPTIVSAPVKVSLLTECTWWGKGRPYSRPSPQHPTPPRKKERASRTRRACSRLPIADCSSQPTEGYECTYLNPLPNISSTHFTSQRTIGERSSSDMSFSTTSLLSFSSEKKTLRKLVECSVGMFEDNHLGLSFREKESI